MPKQVKPAAGRGPLGRQRKSTRGYCLHALLTYSVCYRACSVLQDGNVLSARACTPTTQDLLNSETEHSVSRHALSLPLSFSLYISLDGCALEPVASPTKEKQVAGEAYRPLPPVMVPPPRNNATGLFLPETAPKNSSKF